MRKSNFALRLQPSLLDEARKVAETEGVPLNQLINVAVAEKLSGEYCSRISVPFRRCKRSWIQRAASLVFTRPPRIGFPATASIIPASLG